MNWQRLLFALSIPVGLLAVGPAPAAAQGLIWSLPPDGTWVRYEGTQRQIEYRPDATEGDVSMEWIRQLTIKSVGTEMAEYEGRMQACRWIELKAITGKPSERGVDPGLVGQRIYKVLVPESRIIGQTTDSDTIPVSFIPIIEGKGYQKIGDGETTPIESPVLQVYPVLSMLMHYKTLQAEETEAEDVQVRLGTVPARRYRGEKVMESPTIRTTSEATLWRSVSDGDEVPFGLVKWRVRMVRESKDDASPRSAFKPVSEVTVEMSAHESGDGAESELVTP